MSSPWCFPYMKEPSSKGRCAGHPLNVEGMLEPWPSPAPLLAIWLSTLPSLLTVSLTMDQEVMS